MVRGVVRPIPVNGMTDTLSRFPVNPVAVKISPAALLSALMIAVCVALAVTVCCAGLVFVPTERVPAETVSKVNVTKYL